MEGDDTIMFDRKYRKAMKILDEEIAKYEGHLTVCKEDGEDDDLYVMAVKERLNALHILRTKLVSIA